MEDEERDALDVMNPPGMFHHGKRQREYSITNDPLPLSGKLIPEFFGRRNIRDMFSQKPSPHTSLDSGFAGEKSKDGSAKAASTDSSGLGPKTPGPRRINTNPTIPPSNQSAGTKTKRDTLSASNIKPGKRVKSGPGEQESWRADKGQQSLRGFFKSQCLMTEDTRNKQDAMGVSQSTPNYFRPSSDLEPAAQTANEELPLEARADTDHVPQSVRPMYSAETTGSAAHCESTLSGSTCIHDQDESKESWSRLFTRPVAPRCEGHNEPCITLLTKKPGMNLGRSFWMCPRPLGPSGAKEKNTQWRCPTFIWCSDWNNSAATGG